ncbi:hypothetical protein BGZ76_002831 [Entomortierella beljakovae]|nr:hypothetical protein BGZ76_002831 [Entomortierella beljakovae]
MYVIRSRGSGGGSGTTVTSESKKAWVSMLRQKTLVRASIPQLWETYSEVVNNEALSLLRSDDVVVLYQALSRSIQVEEATEMMLQVALDLSNIDKQLPQEAFQILLNQALDNLPAEQFKAVVWQIQGRRRFISEFIQMCDSNTEMKALIDLYTRLIKDSFPLDGHPDYYQSRKERANSLGDIILNWIKDESDNVDRKVVEGLLVYLLSRGVLDKVYTCIGSLSKQGFLFTHRFYTTAIHQFGCEGEFDYMELTLSLMRNQGLEPLEDTYSAIIDAHSKAGNLREAQRTYQEAVAAGIVPTDTVLGPILEAVGKMGDYGMTQLLVEQMSSTGVPPNEYTFSALLQSVAQNPEKSISLFEELSKQMTPNRVNYNLLIRTLQRHGDLDGAYRIFRSMANNSARPDMYTLSSILSLFASRGDSEGAEAFWNEMVNVHEVVPNVHAYGSMMHVYCVTGNMLSAQSVYREMIKAGILPNEVIFGTLLNAYARRGDLTQMLSIYDAMRAEGLKPNSYIYSNLLFGLVKDGDMASARRLYENMEEDGYGDNVLAQTILMKGYLDKGRFHESQVVYKNMLRAGLIPNFMTYATLLQAHVKRGEKKEAQAFLDKIMSSRGLVVDPEDEREEAAEVEEDKQQGKKETVKLKSTEDRDLSSSLSLEDEGDPQSSFQQGHLSEFGTERKPLKTAARPNPLFAFTPLLDAYAKEGDITAANLIFDEIKARGLQPNTITYTILMDCYKRAGDVDTVKRLWSEMFERFQKQWEINSSRPNNERPSKYTAINLKQDRLSTKASKLQRLMQSPISIVLDSLGYSGRVQEAKNIWGELEKMNYKFDSSNWNDYCIVLLRNGLILDACMILQSILLPGFHSDKEVESGLSTGSEDTFTIKSPRSRVIASDAIQPPSKTSPLSLSNQGNLESTGDMGDLTKGVQRKTLFYPRPRTFAALADALSELLSPNNGSKIRYQEFMSDALIHLPSTPSSSESDVAARSLQSKRLEKQKQLIETKLLAYPHPFDNFDENSRKVLWNLVRTEYPHVLEALSEGMPAASASKRYGKIAKGGEEESNPGTSHRNPRFSGFDPWRRLKSVMRDLERKKFIENRNAAMQEREDRFALLRNRKPR